MSLASASTATAAPAPAFAIRAIAKPTYLAPGATGFVTVLVTNVGGASTNGQQIKITDAVPHGLVVSQGTIEAEPGEAGRSPCENTASTVTCTYEAPLAGDSTEALEVYIAVAVEPDASGALEDSVSVSGGGASPLSRGDAVVVAAGEPPFALDGPFEAGAFDAAGRVDTQAGDHPNSSTTGLVFNSVREPLNPATFEGVQKIKDVSVLLPPGFVGDPLAAATCPEYLVAPPSDGTQCPAGSVVGSVAVMTQYHSWGVSGPVSGNQSVKPVYNVAPARGYPAEFAFIFENQEALLYPSLVHTAAGYAVRVTSGNIVPAAHLTGVKVTFFGDPAAVDGSNGTQLPFFTNPTDCDGGPVVTRMQFDSWQNEALLPSNVGGSPDVAAANFEEALWGQGAAESPAPSGCDALQFKPRLEASLSSRRAGSPSGFDATLRVPQDEDREGLATPPVKDITVTLPKGLVVSPSSANGLAACSDAQFGEASTVPASCPEASQVGTVLVHTPILANPVEGQVFVGAPECSPCSNADAQEGRMVRLFVQVHSDEYGVTIKLAGRVALDPATGQLTATFQDLIQQPFDELEFHFKRGETAPLSTPTACGGYSASVDLTPWSAPYTPAVDLTPGFEIAEGCGAHGFAPAFSAGTTSNEAGAYGPFTLTFSRNDGEQDFSDVEQTLPPGLLAKLAGVPRCGEAEANAGTCPESTRIGSVTVGAGPGADPYYVKGKIYLTGPYNGGPFGEVVEVPAVAGPFNLGVVAVRGSIRVNPSTIQATVVSDPFPSILDGIPLQVRTVNVTLDREGFTVNPTSCAALAVTGKLVSTEGASAGVSSPYQAVNCGNLAFKPDLTASVSGRASKADGAGLDVKVTYPAGPAGTYANTKSVKVDLPKQLPSRLTTLQKACLASVFEANPANCPAASDVGSATAVTPLLGVPVNGPAYLVSHGGEAFPDLEVVLQGEGVTAVVVFNTDIKKGITSSTLKAAPDVPLSSFELKLPTGKYSILGANVPASAKYSLCGQSLGMPTALTGQNGTPIKQTTKIAVTGCPKTKKAGKKKPGKASKSNRRGK